MMSYALGSPRWSATKTKVSGVDFARHAHEAGLRVAAGHVHHDAFDNVGSVVVDTISISATSLCSVDFSEHAQSFGQREATPSGGCIGDGCRRVPERVVQITSRAMNICSLRLGLRQ
jgi:hypothetical protein